MIGLPLILSGTYIMLISQDAGMLAAGLVHIVSGITCMMFVQPRPRPTPITDR